MRVGRTVRRTMDRSVVSAFDPDAGDRAPVALGRVAAEATAELVSGPYRFEVLEGVSHWIPELAPEALGALILEHLAAHP